jgi:hypothetical protein
MGVIMNAQFTVIRETEDAVYLRDSNGKKSITNDAEAVLKYIKETYSGKRCIYQDSYGDWAEIVDEPHETWMGISPVSFKPFCYSI